MMEQFLKEYWPFLLLILWFTYKWWRAKQVKTQLPALKSEGATLVDVRSVGEFAHANAPGTLNIPLSELGSRLNEIPKDKP
ncbi:MAG: Thiosulfate sulfurtransferase PspE precursor, partial [Pseudomonadota bacterium]